jgi:hypothetical protein
MDDMSVMSAGFRLEERGNHDKLFHTKAVVRDRACSLTIDHWSSVNIASIEMVEKLGLPRTPHPQPYYLRWGSDEFTITHQTKIQFCMGKFSGEACCDIIPVYMVSCHFLLGKPWYIEQGAVPYLDHTNRYYKYLVLCGRVEYSLKSMDTVLFKYWRDERLQQKHDQEEAMRMKEAEAKIRAHEEAVKMEPEQAALFSAPVPSTEREAEAVAEIFEEDVQFPHHVLQIYLKPRTVSPEGGRMMWCLPYLIIPVMISLIMLLLR